jgi:hypothetical protein
MTSGNLIEFTSPGDCTLFGPRCETLAKVTPRGAAALLKAGENRARFSCDRVKGPVPRAKVTVIGWGEML